MIPLKHRLEHAQPLLICRHWLSTSLRLKVSTCRDLLDTRPPITSLTWTLLICSYTVYSPIGLAIPQTKLTGLVPSLRRLCASCSLYLSLPLTVFKLFKSSKWNLWAPIYCRSFSGFPVPCSTSIFWHKTQCVLSLTISCLPFLQYIKTGDIGILFTEVTKRVPWVQ